MRGILSLLIIFCAALVQSQSLNVTNVRVAEDGTVSFSAQIAAKVNARERYQLSVYSSVDNYSQPYVFETEELEPALIHDLSFNGNVLIGEYTGQVQFRFAINATVFPITFMKVQIAS